MLPDQVVTAFISHRCEEYHGGGSINKELFEQYLLKYSILPAYGCRQLEPNRTGYMEGTIADAMKESQMFIAFISSSWGIDEDLYWPKKEWQLWKDVWAQEKSMQDNVLGFCLLPKKNICLTVRDLYQFAVDIKDSGDENNCIFSSTINGKRYGIYSRSVNEMNNIPQMIRDMHTKAAYQISLTKAIQDDMKKKQA